MLELLKKRRSVRQFKTTGVEAFKIEELMQAALLSPSSRSNRPLEFVVVTETGTLRELSKAKAHGSEFLCNAPLGIVVLARPGKSDVWIEDASIASIIIQLACEPLGLSSCWIQIRERKHSPEVSSEQFVRSCLSIPADLRVLSIIAIGYADEEKIPYREEELDRTKIHYNSY